MRVRRVPSSCGYRVCIMHYIVHRMVLVVDECRERLVVGLDLRWCVDAQPLLCDTRGDWYDCRGHLPQILDLVDLSGEM